MLEINTSFLKCCIAPKQGVAWFRFGVNTYFIKAPWDEPLFSERYVYKPKSYWGWRFFTRKTNC